MKSNICYVAILLFVLSKGLCAETPLMTSTPADQDNLVESPKTIRLSFDNRVKLIKLKLYNSDDKRIDFGFKPIAQANYNFEYKLPKLADDDYRVIWAVKAGNNDVTEGSFVFDIDKNYQKTQLPMFPKVKPPEQ